MRHPIGHQNPPRHLQDPGPFAIEPHGVVLYLVFSGQSGPGLFPDTDAMTLEKERAPRPRYAPGRRTGMPHEAGRTSCRCPLRSPRQRATIRLRWTATVQGTARTRTARQPPARPRKTSRTRNGQTALQHTHQWRPQAQPPLRCRRWTASTRPITLATIDEKNSRAPTDV